MKNQNFEMFQGDTKNIVVTCGFDLTGASIKWVMKRSPSSTTVDVSKSTASGGISITSASPDSSVFEIKLDPADTVKLSRDYYHEAEVTDAEGNVSTVMIGRVSILQSGV